MLATAQPKTKKFVLGIIPARGGSKRLAKKNIKVLNGKELIAYTIEAAKNSKLLDDFLVSTDDDEIMKVSEKYGALVPFRRPAEISEDVDTVLPLMHAVNWYEGANDVQVTHVVLLQPTSPMRTSEDIDKCVEIALNAHAESVISFKKAKEHPFWCFTLSSFNHEMTPFMPEVQLEGDNLVWQNLPLCFYPNGAVYVCTRDLVMNQQRIYGRHIVGYIMPEARSIDIEDEVDFLECEAIMAWLKEKDGAIPKISWGNE